MVSNKNLIYIVILAVLLLGSLFILAIYYTQDFDTNLAIKDSIQVTDIAIESRLNNQDQSNDLISAEALLGEITLDNTNGLFTQVYSPPIIFGCLNLQDTVAQDSKLRQADLFTVGYVDRSNELGGRYTYNTPQNIQIKKGSSSRLGESSSVAGRMILRATSVPS